MTDFILKIDRRVFEINVNLIKDKLTNQEVSIVSSNITEI